MEKSNLNFEQAMGKMYERQRFMGRDYDLETLMKSQIEDAVDFFVQNKYVTKIGIFARSQSGMQQACLYDERILCRVVQSPAIKIREAFAYWYPDEWKDFQNHLEKEYISIASGDLRKVKGPYRYSRKYFDEQDEIKKLSDVVLPKITHTLIMQGNEDKEVEPKHSFEIYNLLARPKEYHIIDGAGHPYTGYEDRVIALTLFWFNKFLR